MKKVLKIDNQGYFIEDVILENELVPSDCIDIQCLDGFYKPKWNGSEWIEGLTQTEIDALKNVSIEKTEMEILKETLDTLVLTSLGGL